MCACVSVCVCLCCVECLCSSQVKNKRKFDEQRSMWHINVGTESPASRPGFSLVYLTYTRHTAVTPNTSFETWQGQKQHGARNIASRIRITRVCVGCLFLRSPSRVPYRTVAGLRMEPAMSSSRHYHVVFTALLNLPRRDSRFYEIGPCLSWQGGMTSSLFRPPRRRRKFLWSSTSRR